MLARVTKAIAFCTAALLIAFLQSQSLRAQERGERGYIEIGARVSTGDDKASKYLEYRDIPNGFYIRRMEVRLTELLKGKYFFTLQSRETIERDQTHLLEVGRHGKFRFHFRWDQTPHFFTNTTSSLFSESAPGVFSYPSALRTQLQTSPSTLPTVLKSNVRFDTRLRRHLGVANFISTPTDHLTLQFRYSRESMIGWRPIGTATNSFTNSIELPEPIDYRTHFTNLGAEYASKKVALQIGFTGSIFKNNIGTLVWDNPFRTTDTTSAGSRGRIDLYPDNSAYTLSFAASLKLPKKTRFIASIVRGWMRQNDAFLPFTINTATANVPALPATSLHGEKKTLAMNYTLTSKIIHNLPLTVRYRSYDYDNDTPSLTFGSYVRTDASLNSVVRRSLAYSYSKQNLTADAAWQFGKASSVKFGYEWERMHRKFREVDVSDEHSVTAALDLSPKQWQNWFLFRMSYRHSDRQPKDYEINEDSFPFGEPGLGELHGLRKFDEAARSRDVAQALLQIDPTDKLSFSASYGTDQNDYKKSLYGLQKDISYNYTFDVTYNINPSITFFSDFAREKYKYNLRSRQRTATNDSALNDWLSDMHDRIDTGEAGIEGRFLENKITYEAYYSLSASKGLIRTSAFGTPGTPGFLVTTARNYPNTSNRLHSLVGSLRLKLKENFYPRVEYRFEKYGRTDFQTDVMAPFMGSRDSGTGTSIFLGADNRPYKVHGVTFSLGYQF